MNGNLSKPYAMLVIERPAASLSIYRKYKVFVDNEVVCQIKNGETLTVPLTAEKNSLYAKIDWVKSNKIALNVAKNEIVIVQITLQKFSRFKTIFLYSLVPLGIILGNIFGGGIGAGVGACFGVLFLASVITKPLVKINI